MARNDIPERAPLGDVFNGVLVQFSGRFALTLTAPLEVEVVRQGEFVVRYAVRYLGKTHLSVVPGLLALDYGEILTGEAAWDFLLTKSNLHPRADVIGYRNDGLDEMIPVKKLDPVAPIEVLVYASAAESLPLASVSALLAKPEAVVHHRIREYLPSYESLIEWQAVLDKQSG